jgi:hypothetical protein
VLEAALAVAASTAVPLLEKKMGNDPLLSAVFKAVLAQVQKSAETNKLFATVSDGSFFAALYKTTLRSVASNPSALASQAGLDQHVAGLISACASELASAGIDRAFASRTLSSLVEHAIAVAGEHPEFIGAHATFVGKIVAAALTASARGAKINLSHDDLLEITEAVVRMAAGNVALTSLDERVRSVVAAFSEVLSDEGVGAFTSASRRKELFLAGLDALTTNSNIWGKFSSRELVQPVLAAIIGALKTNPSGLLSGPALVPVFQQTLEAVALHGNAFLSGKTTPAALQIVLTTALKAAEAEVGHSIDAKTLPPLLRATVRAFLIAPFEVNVGGALADLVKRQLALAA